MATLAPALTVPIPRRPAFDLAGADPRWSPRAPEFAATANAVSLLMPHIEPYFVRSTNRVMARLPVDLQAQARGYVAQEASHQRAHRAWNDRLVGAYPLLGRLDRCIGAAYRRVESRRTVEFSVGLAAASETIAYNIARWTYRHHREVIVGADEHVAALFMWHLGEEVEHRSVAFDVDRAVNPSRRQFVCGAAVSLALLAVFAVVGCLIMLGSDRRLFRPVTWWRLTRWSLSFWFQLAPALVVAATSSHHPSRLAGLDLYSALLRDIPVR